MRTFITVSVLFLLLFLLGCAKGGESPLNNPDLVNDSLQNEMKLDVSNTSVIADSVTFANVVLTVQTAM